LKAGTTVVETADEIGRLSRRLQKSRISIEVPREAGKVGRSTMQRFVCPECGDEAELTPRYGDAVVSVYCLKHDKGIDRQAHPVLMIEAPVAAPAVELEAVKA